MQKITLDFDIYKFEELPEYGQESIIADYCYNNRDYTPSNISLAEYAKNKLINSEKYLFIKNGDDEFEMIDLDDIESYSIPIRISLSTKDFNFIK